MKEIANKLVAQEEEISREKGAFNLFALFLRAEALDRWDLLVAAPWVTEDREAALKFIAERLQKTLTKEEILKLSRIVTIDEKDSALEALYKVMQIEHSMMELQESDFFGLRIKHAYVITSKRPEQPAPSPPGLAGH